MRRLMLVLPILLVFAACGGKKEPTPAPSSSTQQSGASSTDTSPVIADLFSLLVTDQELPGWQFVPTRPSITGPNDPCNAATAPGTAIANAMLDQSATYLTKGSDGPFVVEQINRFPSSQTVSDVLKQVSAALTCKTWTDSDASGNTLDWKLESLKVGKIGQESVSTMSSQSDGSVNIGVVYMQEGSYLVSIAYLSTDKPDASTVADIAKKADAKVKHALSSATQ